MTYLFPKPSLEDVAACIRRCFPSLAFVDVRYMSEGWDSWVFETLPDQDDPGGTCLFRIPKHDYTLHSHVKERLLMPAIAPMLPVAVPDTAFACADGPNGYPFVGYRKIPGTPLADLPGFRSAAIGRPIGRFLKALHSLPVTNFEASFPTDPVRKAYGGAALDRLGSFYERVVREVFSLVSCEARELTRERFEGFLHNPSNFDYPPCIVHSDLNADHVLVDAATGELTGIIDFGDAEIGDPAGDWADIFGGSLGEAMTPAGVAEAMEAYGEAARTLEPRARFFRSLGPYHEVIGGLSLGDNDILENGLRRLTELAKGREPCP